MVKRIALLKGKKKLLFNEKIENALAGTQIMFMVKVESVFSKATRKALDQEE